MCIISSLIHFKFILVQLLSFDLLRIQTLFFNQMFRLFPSILFSADDLITDHNITRFKIDTIKMIAICDHHIYSWIVIGQAKSAMSGVCERERDERQPLTM